MGSKQGVDESCAEEGTAAPALAMTDSGEFHKANLETIDKQGRELGEAKFVREQYERTIHDLNNKLQAAVAEAQNADAVLAVAIKAAKTANDDKERVQQDLLKEMRLHGEARKTNMEYENIIAALRATANAMRQAQP